MSIGIMFRLESFWIGAHYSKRNKRWCINPIPGMTVWITKKDGIQPYKFMM